MKKLPLPKVYQLIEPGPVVLLEVVAAWHDTRRKNPKTIHHRGFGNFVVDGRAMKLRSRMR